MDNKMGPYLKMNHKLRPPLTMDDKVQSGPTTSKTKKNAPPELESSTFTSKKVRGEDDKMLPPSIKKTQKNSQTEPTFTSKKLERENLHEADNKMLSSAKTEKNSQTESTFTSKKLEREIKNGATQFKREHGWKRIKFSTLSKHEDYAQIYRRVDQLSKEIAKLESDRNSRKFLLDSKRKDVKEQLGHIEGVLIDNRVIQRREQPIHSQQPWDERFFTQPAYGRLSPHLKNQCLDLLNEVLQINRAIASLENYLKEKDGPLTLLKRERRIAEAKLVSLADQLRSEANGFIVSVTTVDEMRYVKEISLDHELDQKLKSNKSEIEMVEQIIGESPKKINSNKSSDGSLES